MNNFSDQSASTELDMLAIDATATDLLRKAAADNGAGVAVVDVIRRFRHDAGDLDEFTRNAGLLVNALVLRGGELLRMLAEVTGESPEDITRRAGH